MADNSPESIAALRRMVDEPGTETYTDEALSALLDAEESADAAAAGIWREKAARASTLVNVSESGSSRSLQQIYSNALDMAKFYDGRAVAEEPVVEDSAFPFTVAVERL